MASVAEIYASPWLKPDDLQGRTVKVRIAKAGLEEVRQADGSTQNRVVVDFVGAKKRMILNKSQGLALAAIAGDDTAEWGGTEILLSPSPTPQGKRTITILAAEQPQTDQGALFN